MIFHDFLINYEICALLIFLFLLFFFHSSIYAGTPASPSSSYKNDYYRNKTDLNSDNQQIIPQNTQLIVQGNVRLDSSLIIKDANIDPNKTDQKKPKSVCKKTL